MKKVGVKFTLVGSWLNLLRKEKNYSDTHNRGEAIYSINTKDDSKSKKVFDAQDSIVYDVDIMGDTLWIATIPNYSWEEMTIQQ